MSHKLNSAIAVVGIDIGKNSFHVVGQDKRGEIVLRQKWSRGQRTLSGKIRKRSRDALATGYFLTVAPFDFEGDFTSADGVGLTGTGTTPIPMA